MLTMIGLSHKTAPLEVRERLAFGEEEVPEALRAVRALPGVREAYLLSTCNRTEVYLCTWEQPDLGRVAEALARLRRVDKSSFLPHLGFAANEEAARHLLRVAAGLESMVVGENQILGQVRRAFAAARATGATGPVLHRLLQVAIACGRRVRAETGLGRRSASIPHAAFDRCRRSWGVAHDRTVGIVGAGEMAQLAAKAFSAGGARIRFIANRTLEAAEALASRYGAEAIPLDVLAPALDGLDALVVSVGADHAVIGASSVAGRDGSAPLLVVDIGVPRGVDPEVGRLPGVTLIDLDMLGPEAVGPTPPEDVAAAEVIVEEALEAFLRWQGARAAEPVIAALHHRAERIVEEELERARARLHRLDERERRAVRGVVEGALRKLLHAPFVRLRARGDDARVLALARELFDLDGDLDGGPGG
ncbi:MAG: glutamyl-tRNA reductase [Armatimonadota bacterium]|nr:glutamyl-tRNA reductase [Armatimonadota bacterium]MDR7572716.1 glutamyl-tRNA reductase [Armatimonadota bacterium]